MKTYTILLLCCLLFLECKNETGSDDAAMRNMTSMELSKLMGIGWNLGNTLEATGGETSWGNPKVTADLIRAVKEAGFKSVRIPVSWAVHVTDQSTCKIDNAWMQRVGQVVNYVLDQDMFAIINIHWDNGWMNDPRESSRQQINARFNTIWTQIATYFKDYDDRLLFAGSNEVHMEGDWSSSPPAEYLSVQNSFNQTFVDAVRKTGGRNLKRHLVIQSYLTNIDLAYKSLIIPQDPTPGRLMVEVHYYDPYEFALKEDEPYDFRWGSVSTGPVTAWGQEDWVESSFGKMKKFTDRGLPIILGEYGALYRLQLTGDELTEHKKSRSYYLEYITEAAIRHGMVPFYWDNGAPDFVLISRSSNQVVHPDALQAIMKSRL
ncbi:MAG TPA: glycoside hydrolase family 5 protein [Bacteroidales bacterium]|nr:MAG: Endoglucanase A precursor [Bacteroidetes bacterium ADurb.Bin139]HOG25360.1 glycoside hydrolase family 5 protein [Bacteroidales bacterium]HOR12070.1 glycoside hydrolase family 5 protein [Bacteroidales bacterium]HPB78259.1 glycoside hydrolase family 5 protein [Bacteroidales bacterium]HQN81263.1 glycoside hydrolase family 5 protein [Bacteroidales bacterium]